MSIAHICALCGDSSNAAIDAMAEYGAVVPGVDVCFSCADRVANAFSMKHTGQWFTWLNIQSPPKYKKDRIDAMLQRRVHERYAYRCVTCASFFDLTCDHIVPESKGGATEFKNLQTMCRPCNSRKGTN